MIATVQDHMADAILRAILAGASAETAAGSRPKIEKAYDANGGKADVGPRTASYWRLTPEAWNDAVNTRDQFFCRRRQRNESLSKTANVKLFAATGVNYADKP